MGRRSASMTVVAAALGCGGETVEPEPTPEEIIGDEVGDLVLHDCGTIETGVGNCQEPDAPPEIEPKLACILEAWQQCRPAKLVNQSTSVEGFTNPHAWFVLPAADSCKLVRYTDWTADPYGACQLLRSECTPYDDTRVMGCPWLWPSTCTQSETVYRDPECGGAG